MANTHLAGGRIWSVATRESVSSVGNRRIDQRRKFLRSMILKLFIKAATLVSGLYCLFSGNPGTAHALERPPIPVTTHLEPSESERQALDRKALAVAAYQKGHDALTAGRRMLAIEQFEFACERLDAKSCFNVGLLVEAQSREPLSSSRAGIPDRSTVGRITSAFRESCYLGFKRGCAALVQYYRSPYYNMQNLPAAIEFATAACDAGEISGCEDLAEMHYRGEGMPVSLTRAAVIFKDGCDAGGRALSCFNYALMNEKGQGLAINAEVAVEYYRIGCRRGSDLACINLAMDYRRSALGTADREIASGLMEKSCKNGEMLACSNLAVMTEESDPSPMGKIRAASLYRQACDGGDGGACRGLGNLASDGVKEAGTRRDATKFFVKGCQLQSGRSCYNAGLMYYIGFRTPNRPRTALAWFSKGCNLGSPPSCAGAALAAFTMKPGDPDGGKEVAIKWLDHARYHYPEDGLVKALDGWLTNGANPSETPHLPEQGGAN
jgi:uncharacterized protein